jgi:hypothetical protein
MGNEKSAGETLHSFFIGWEQLAQLYKRWQNPTKKTANHWRSSAKTVL